MHSACSQFGMHFSSGFSAQQRFGLRNAVCQQNVMVPGHVVSGMNSHDKIRGCNLRALMQMLEKGMLAIGPRRTPDDRPREVMYRSPRTIHSLAVALHVELLQKSRKMYEILRIRQHRLGAVVKEIDVPYADQRGQYRQVELQWSAAEVLIHFAGATEELLEMVEADCHCYRQANG